ncbi:GGDEF domain-containing protein [Treponema sp.]|uniref:GGDEF domain-containing protein n=1 Tax=Treponema sp. TaxID=166 RepID=UPI00388FA512
MNIRWVIKNKFQTSLFTLIAVSIVIFAIFRISLKIQNYNNQLKISETLAHSSYQSQDYNISEIKKLLELKSLTPLQKAEIYNALSVAYYISNQMEEYLKTVGSAIFFNEYCGNTENVVQLYSFLSQYYLELGADKAGFDTILQARRIKNFYSINNPMIQNLALHAYSRFLIYESDFVDAMKAQSQMEENSQIIKKENESLGNELYATALCLKSYILLMQGKTEEAYSLICEIYDNYDKIRELTHTTVYDIYLPVFFVKTQWAIRTGNYKKAIEFAHEYGSYAKKFNFTMKKTKILKDLMFALPESMTKEKNKLFNELAFDTDFLAQNFLTNYTETNAEKLSGIIENLKHSTERQISHNRTLEFVFIDFIIFLTFILILSFIYTQTQIDGLTHLRNRRSLNTRIGKLASSRKKYSAIMIDIDDFKKLNDNFGHDFGDEVLRTVAHLLLTNENRNVKSYRYGGEEMVIILEHFDLEHAVRFSEHVRTEISNLKWRKDVHVTASFGLGFEMPDSVKEADENMYIAKQKGKNFTAYRKDGKQYLAERRLDIRNPMPDKF